MAVVLGIFRLLFIDTTIDKAVVVSNLQLVAQSRNAAQRPLEVACCRPVAASPLQWSAWTFLAAMCRLSLTSWSTAGFEYPLLCKRPVMPMSG